MKTTVVTALSLALAIASSGLQAQTPERPAAPPREVSIEQISDVPKLLGIVNQLQIEKDWENAALVWRRLAQLRPHKGDYHYSEAAMYALQDKKSEAYSILLQLQRKGFAYPLDTDPRFEKIRGTEVWGYLVELNKAALAAPFGEGEVAFELAPADLLLESIAYDSSREAFLFGSARDGRIYRRDNDGSLDAWIESGEGRWSILALAVDARRNSLWATTSAIPHFKDFKADDSGKAALLKFDLRSGRLQGRYPVPEDGMPHLPAVITLGGRGEVYVGEGLRGQLYKLDGERLQPIMAERRIGGVRGLALIGNTLYFADGDLGLFGLDLSKGMAFDVKYPETVALGGIEGLYAYQGQLVVVQNGMRPKRVMRLKLSEDGREIEQGTPLEAGQPAFGTLTWGTVKGDDLYFIANSQREHYDGYGVAKSSAGKEAVKIYRTPIRFNWDFKPPSLPDSLNPLRQGNAPAAPAKKDD